MLKRMTLLFLTLATLAGASACGRQAAPETGPVRSPAAKGAPAPEVKQSWETEWAKGLAEGKKEGVVVIYSIMEPGIREVLKNAFKAKHGIDLEFVAGRGTELLARARSERAAGLFTGDVLMGGPTTCLTFKEANALDPIQPVMILPEVKDTRNWVDGRFHFFEKDGYGMAYWAVNGSTWIVNSDMVRPEEVASYNDLLNPKWKEKMTLVDPTMTGSGNQLVGINMWEIMGEAYVKALAAQKPVVTRDLRLHVESVARGKYPIGLAADPEVRLSFQRAGAAIKQVLPTEGSAKIAGAGGLAVFNKAPHPNATRVFINWLLSREGQTIIGKEGGAASRRIDVPADHVDPDRVLKPGVKYVEADTEETIRLRVERQAASRDIFGIR